MQRWLLLLGNTPDLSIAEFKAVYPKVATEYITTQVGDWLLVSADQDFAPDEAMNRLGGIIKITSVTTEVDQQTSDDGLKNIAAQEILKVTDRDKPQFGLTWHTGEYLFSEKDLKEELADQGVPSRYLPTKQTGIAAAITLKDTTETTDLFIVPHNNSYFLSVTVATQDIDDWTLRDRKKPFAERKRGMLPPKVARMMLNVGLGEQEAESITLFDPFCGTGTILLEGQIVGVSHLVGSDIDQEAVIGTQRNIAWLSDQYKISTPNTLFVSDVMQPQYPQQIKKSVNLMVTEPFLGKMTPNQKNAANIIKGLHKMFLGAFKKWRPVLKDGAIIVIALPKLVYDNREYRLDDLVDKLSQLGYTSTSETYVYGRENATTQREITTFRYSQQ